VSDEELVNDMERIRSANNVNWMNLVRLALRVAPEEARAIFADIQQKDREIAGIIQRLGEAK
jgi:hypothetical protein